MERSAEDGIHSISASSITGNILVFYDAGKQIEEIIAYLELVVERVPAAQRMPEAREESGKNNQRAGFMGLVRELLGLAPAQHAAAPELTPAVTRRGSGWPVKEAPAISGDVWHSKSAEQVAMLWGTSLDRGLAETEAAARLARYGANVLSPPHPRSALSLIGEQFVSLPVLLLIGSAALSLVTGGIADAVLIGAVVVLNAGIGFATEYRAERTILSLLELSEPEATVIRDRAVHRLAGDAVVPGDLMVLARGQAVVADARLVACTRLTVDEATLTGESMPLEKSPDTLATGNLVLADRQNMVYRGTMVTGGQGLAIVVATGQHTEIGRIQALLVESAQPETPLHRQMRELGIQLTWFICVVSAAIFAIGLLRGLPALEMLRVAVALVIAAVPEGLPTVATISLANGMRSLLREKVLARRLAAVETLGGVQIVCFDKTGTLTRNRMSAVAVHVAMRQHAVSGTTFVSDDHPISAGTHTELLRFLEICSLCSEATIEIRNGEWVVEGSPTESALIRMALNGGVDVAEVRRRLPLLRTQYRTESDAYMATWHQLPDGRTLVAVKGSPNQVLRLCDWYATDGRIQKLGDAQRREILAANAAMAAKSLRVLGVASLETSSAGQEAQFVWLGLAGLADPPRHGLKEVIAEFRRAGVRPLMLTGDQAATAEAVAESLDLSGGEKPITVHASELEDLDTGAAAARIRKASIFSRVTPSNKLQIVRALQREGATVAMTGDGINDAPALKAADIGIALGQSGQHVARGVADLLLLDDNVASLLPAIRVGRTVYTDLRKAVHYIAATNTSEMLTMFTCIAAGLGQPFNPRQLLWINLISDIFPELALAVEPASPGIMSQPPRDSAEPVIARPDYLPLGRQSAIMSASAMAAYLIGRARYGGGAPAATMAFLALTSAQLLHGLSARSEYRGQALPPNPTMRNGLFAGFGLLVASQLIPGVASVLGTSPIGTIDALICAGTAVASFLANEFTKPLAPGRRRFEEELGVAGGKPD